MIFDEATVIVPAAATRGIDRREFTLVDLIVTAMYFYLMAACFASLFNSRLFIWALEFYHFGSAADLFV